MPLPRPPSTPTGAGFLLVVTSFVASLALWAPDVHSASGFLDRLSREVRGGTVESIRAMVPQAAVTSATDRFCGSTPDAWCRNLTDSVVGSFSEEFVARMTREDLEQASEARERAIRTGEPQVWENPESGARGEVQSMPAEPRPPAATAVTVEETVELTAPILDAVGEPYRVRVDVASILSGPGAQYTPVAELRQGDRINAIARVQQTDWYLVGEGPIGKGYLDGVAIEPVPVAESVRAAAPPAAQKPVQKPVQKPAPKKAAKQPDPGPPAAAGTRQVEVAMAAECYTTTQRVTLADGTSEEASVTSCRTPNGWVQV